MTAGSVARLCQRASICACERAGARGSSSACALACVCVNGVFDAVSHSAPSLFADVALSVHVSVSVAPSVIERPRCSFDLDLSTRPHACLHGWPACLPAASVRRPVQRAGARADDGRRRRRRRRLVCALTFRIFARFRVRALFLFVVLLHVFSSFPFFSLFLFAPVAHYVRLLVVYVQQGSASCDFAATRRGAAWTEDRHEQKICMHLHACRVTG